MPRKLALCVLGSLILLPFSWGCSTAEDAYNDFRDRAATAQPPTDGGADSTSDKPFDGSIFGDASPASLSGSFWGACLTSAAGGNPDQALYSVLKITVTVGGDGTAQATVVSNALKLGAKTIADIVGTPVTPPVASIAIDGTFKLKMGTFVIPKEADPLAFDLTVENANYDGRVAPSLDSLCADFTGMITNPVKLDLSKKGENPCVFFRAPADGSVKKLEASAFHCP
ncbi:MAG: hypothetical protein NVS3B20_25310 [Polyangiales bacterium]